MTDWGIADKGKATSHEVLNAGNDLIMPGGKRPIKKLISGLRDGRLGIGKIRESA